MLYLDIPDFKLLITAIRTAAEQAQEDINLTTGNITLGTCQKLAGGEGVETEGESQLFETAEKGGVMKNGSFKRGGSCKYMPMIM